MTREKRNEKKQKEIQKEEHVAKIKKRTFSILKIILIILGCILGLLIYSRFVGAKFLEVKEEAITSKNLPDSFHGFKIIQFSDLHYGSTVFSDELSNLIEEINIRKPDMVVFTGDLISPYYEISKKERENLIKKLQEITSVVGKYAVFGNEDVKTEDYTDIMTQSGFTILDNNSELIFHESNEAILLVGLNSSLEQARDIDKSFTYFQAEGHNQDIFTITLLHEPDSIDNILTKYKTDLALAGHSLNGQVQIPFVGAVHSPIGAKKYVNEFYQVKNTKLYVSSGVGTSLYPFRLFNHPSISFFRLMKK